MNATVSGDRLAVKFERFDLEEYGLFLRTKKLPESVLTFDELGDTYTLEAPARFASILGLQVDAGPAQDLPLPGHLFDYQLFLVKTALAAKRYAIWADCGLGKTAMFLEYARQVIHRTGGRVLIFSPLAVIGQTVEECRRWYGLDMRMKIICTRDGLADWCQHGGDGCQLAICNYQKMIPGQLNELRHLAGLILDESSLLKSGGGVIKWNLIKSARGIEYKLSCTATPAPNDIMEYASQASFLEKLRSEGEILWTYFVRNKRGVWKVKPHAREAFFRFMAGWSIYLRNPAAFGWTDNLSNIPEPVVFEYPIEATDQQRKLAHKAIVTDDGMLFNFRGEGVVERNKTNQIAKGFLYRTKDKKKPIRVKSLKPAFVANLIAQEVAAGRQTLVWTLYDEETAIIQEAIGGKVEAAVLSGKVKPRDRITMLERFRTGEVKCLISKASLLGFGMNFQHCKAMIFSGWNDSYEQWYQAVRRAYRYGQTDAVRVHVPFIAELEGQILANVLRKRERFTTEAAECEQHYRQAMEGMVAA